MPSKKTSKVICDKKISKVSIKNLHNKAFINILIDYACIYVYFTCICISDVNNHFYINDKMESTRVYHNYHNLQMQMEKLCIVSVFC